MRSPFRIENVNSGEWNKGMDNKLRLIKYLSYWPHDYIILLIKSTCAMFSLNNKT